MISVEDALISVKTQIEPTKKTVLISLEKALGFILAEDILSPINMPLFNQSAMDGYAIKGIQDTRFTLVGEVQAGNSEKIEMKTGESVRIFTGAPVPESADAVIMQEIVDVIEDGKRIELQKKAIQNQNIRPKGEQITQGELALKKGCKINSAIVGFLSGLGITEIKVFCKPNISIIATGNELIEPGNPLKYGEIYESNAIMLKMACTENGFSPLEVTKVKDDFESTKQTLEKAINQSDIVLITGGISVGDYDFVGKALIELGVKEHFYKVKQKPGKPLFFGQVNEAQVFALPGNPAAALTGFYIYVLNALRQFSHDKPIVKPKTGKLTSAFAKKGNRAQFLKAFVNENDTIEILTGQSSAMLRAFSNANAFVFIPEDKMEVEANENVIYYSIPHV